MTADGRSITASGLAKDPPDRVPDVGQRPAAGQVESLAVGARAQAGHENFPVALRLLPARYRRHLMAVYAYARTVDDIGDEAPPADRLRLLAELEDDVRRLYPPAGRPGAPAGPGTPGSPSLAVVAGLRESVADCGIPLAPLVDLIVANRQDQEVSRYETFADLLGYCRLSANPVGRIVLHVFGCHTAERAELSDLICTGLQLAEHWQDVAEDLRAGRIYLPQEDLRGYACTERDLAQAHAGPGVRALMAFEVRRARSLIDQGAPLIGTLRGAARAAVAGYVAGGRAALHAIAAADYDVLAAAPRPSGRRTVAELAGAWAKGR